MSKYRCVLRINSDLYDSLAHESNFGEGCETKISKKDGGFEVLMESDRLSRFIAAVNYWLRLINVAESVGRI